MMRTAPAWLLLLSIWMTPPMLSAAAPAAAPTPAATPGSTFIEGEDYEVISPPQRTSVPKGMVEVMEVFSYGCVHCNMFQPVIERLRAALPPNARLTFLPASFLPAEDWPMFQRAFLTAQSLGIAERTHAAMFDAVWLTGELAIIDPGSRALRQPLPSIEDAARFYARTAGIKEDLFLARARSPEIEARMQAADEQIQAMHVPGTPCLIVNGRYRVLNGKPRSVDRLIELVLSLLRRESGTN